MSSNSFLSSFLRYCPIDILQHILHYVDTEDYCYLWSSGDRKLQSSLEKSVSVLFLENRDATPLPCMLYRLSHLKALKIKCYQHIHCDSIKILDLSRLASNLHKLVVLTATQSQKGVSWLACIGSGGLQSILPVLHTLTWSSRSMEALHSFLPFPETLKHLAMTLPSEVTYDASYSAMAQFFLAQLPVGLEKLYFLARILFPDDYCPSFPSSLTSLRLWSLEPNAYSGMRYLQYLTYLPLTMLEIGKIASPDLDYFPPLVIHGKPGYKVDIWPWIPATVTTLRLNPNPDFVTLLDVRRLPRDLKRVYIPSFVTRLSSVAIWSQLPHVEEAVIGLLVEGEPVDDLAARVIPRHFRTVHLGYEITKTGIESLPDGVWHLHAPAQVLDLPATRLPPHLKSFKISDLRNSFSKQFQMILPSTLTSLDLGNVVQALPVGSRLPSSLTNLTCWSCFFHGILADSPERRNDTFHSEKLPQSASKAEFLKVHMANSAWTSMSDLFPSALKILQLKTETGNNRHVSYGRTRLWLWPSTAILLPKGIHTIKCFSLAESYEIEPFNTWTKYIPNDLTSLKSLSIIFPNPTRVSTFVAWNFGVYELPTSLTKLHIAATIDPTLFKALPPHLRSLALDPPSISNLWTIEDLQTMPKSLTALLLMSQTIHLKIIRERIVAAISLKPNRIDFLWNYEI